MHECWLSVTFFCSCAMKSEGSSVESQCLIKLTSQEEVLKGLNFQKIPKHLWYISVWILLCHSRDGRDTYTCIQALAQQSWNHTCLTSYEYKYEGTGTDKTGVANQLLNSFFCLWNLICQTITFRLLKWNYTANGDKSQRLKSKWVLSQKMGQRWVVVPYTVYYMIYTRSIFPLEVPSPYGGDQRYEHTDLYIKITIATKAKILFYVLTIE